MRSVRTGLRANSHTSSTVRLDGALATCKRRTNITGARIFFVICFFFEWQMLPDVLSLIMAHLKDTASLLVMRRTCKQAKAALVLERIMGMSFAESRLLFDNTAIPVGTMSGEAVSAGLQIVHEGASCVLWTRRRSNAIELAQFSHGKDKWHREFSFEVSAPGSVYLWICMGTDGVLCTLADTENPDRPLVFTTLRLRTDGRVMCTTIDRDLLLQGDSIKPGSLLYACWEGRSFLIILPCAEHCQKVGVLDITHQEERWEWWEVSVSTRDNRHMQLGPMHQLGKFIFIMPIGGAVLFQMCLDEAVPQPRLCTTLPELPATVDAIKVSNNHLRILACSTSEGRLFSVTQSSVDLLSADAFGAFFFASNNAAVVFYHASNTYRVYNLIRNELVRECRLDHIPYLVAFDSHAAMWTVETCLRVRRLVKAPTA